MTSSGNPAQGETIGHYRVGRRLGDGGMGVVHEALDLNLDRPVALKVIAPALAEDPEFRARFTREAQAQASLDSPHVVPVYAHGEDAGRLWIASRLVPDGDLRAMLTAYGAPPLPVALDVMAQVADGLAAAHAAGLVHRDIKPANVLLQRRSGGFQAYLADFGIARKVDAEVTRTASSATVGTPSYMAPELHTGGTPGVASDVYSLGCLLWAGLAGRAPYAGTSDYEIVTAHREAPVPQLPAGTPLVPPLNALLARLMDKDPAARPTSAGEVRDELRRLADLARRPAPPAGPAPSAPGPPARRRLGVPLALAAVAVLLLGVMAIVWAVRDDDSSGPEAGSDRATGSTPSPSSGETPTETPSESATDPTTGPEVAKGDEAKAVASMADAFDDQLGISYGQAKCVAAATIDAVGLQHLVDIGMFDADLAFTDIDLADHPDVKAALSTATLQCLGT